MHHIFLFSVLFPSPASLSRDSTDAVADWRKCEAISELQAQFLIDWRLEGKFLYKNSEENEQLRPGQLFSQASSLSYVEKKQTDESLSQLTLVHQKPGVHTIKPQILN